ncbi:hypothetical protein GALL_513760 [mine drainage metagenome]|uniref:Uncharacterized protein n=1 Tax=mine drainage metagenome TaxID=410659 RepID=A0A1J5P8I0_9ZZZZ
MRNDVAEVIAAVELRRYRGLVPQPDRTAAVAGARDPLRNADGARQPAITQPAQFAIDQMIGDQAGIGLVVTDRRHDADRELMRLVYRELHDDVRCIGRSAERPGPDNERLSVQAPLTSASTWANTSRAVRNESTPAGTPQ